MREQPDSTIHGLIEARAVARPAARALVFGGAALTYGELDARANQLAQRLVRHGVGPDVIVGVHMERSLDLVVAMLAVLKAGGAYLPLDPNYPADRLAFMLADTRAPVVVSDRSLHAAFGGVCIDVRAEAAAIAHEPSAPVIRDIAPANLAYIIYTSGSTGTPKGVLVSHGHVTRLMWSTEPWFHFDEHDIWTFFHSYAFDFSVWEIWGALIYGGAVVVVPEHARKSPDELLALLATHRVTVLNQIPSAFRHLIAAATRTPTTTPLALRYVIFGGEALELRSLVPWFERYPAAPRLVNMYGITETTVHVTYRVIEPAECLDPKGSPIGVPIPDLEMYVLDGALRPVCEGEEGEIYVGGAGLARGYHERPALTAQRFIPDPFSGRSGARLYKTGDLARRLPDGSFEYLGRNDAQVKVRGYRIETGEISSILATHAGVREAAVVAREVGEDDRRLVAYVALNAPTSPDALREHLAARLPAYMVPSAFVVVDGLPITPSGKIDHKALPAPDWTAQAIHAAYVAPTTDDERIMAALWASAIGVDRIGRDDRFFALGGHSLLATQVAARLGHEYGTSVPVRLFLTSPTLAEAAAAFGEARLRQGGRARDVRTIPARPDPERAPISFAQESIWIHERIMQDVLRRPLGYMECPVIQLRGRVALPLLERTLNEIAARHEIWRTSFVLEEEPVQLIARSARIAIKLVDRRGAPAAERRSELERAAETLASQPFVLARAPLVRAALITFSDDEHALILVMHHLITDAWSEGLIADELARLYGFLAAGETLPPRTEVDVQFADHAAWERDAQHEHVREAARAFWRAQLTPAPEPLVLPHAAGEATRRPVRLRRSLGAARSHQLTAFCRRHNVSPSTALYAALAMVLAPHARDGRFVLGVAHANRPPGTERLPGCFTGVLPLVIDLADPPSFEVLAGRLMAGIADAMPHALPLPEIARLVGRSKGPLVQVQASTQLAAKVHTAGGIEVRQDYVPLNDAKFALEMVVQEQEDRSVTLSWVADPASLSGVELERIAAGVEDVLARCIAEPVAHEVPAEAATIAKLWCEVLKVGKVGLRDDFYELGGHSLLAIRLVAKLRAAFGVEVSLGTFLETLTVEGLAAEVVRLRASANAVPVIRRVPRDGVLPASNAQERVWFVERMLAKHGPRPFNVSIAVDIRGKLDAARLGGALSGVIARHEVLRTNFRLVERKLVQVVAAPYAVDLAVEHAEPAETCLALARAQARPAFDLAADRLVRANLVELAPEHHVLLLTIHHIVFDGETVPILVRELAALYDGAPLPPLELQYADLAHWQSHVLDAVETERQLAFWGHQLADAPVLELPADRARPHVVTHAGEHLQRRLPRGLAAAARMLAQREGASLFATLLAAFVAQLVKRTQQTDVIVGTVASMREHPAFEGALGLHLNVLALRVDASGDPTFRELVQRVRDVVVDALKHKDVPFDRVVGALRRERSRELFRVAFGLSQVGGPVAAPAAQTWDVSLPDTGSVLDDLSLQISEVGDELDATFEFRTELFDRSTIAQLAAELEATTVRALAAPDEPLSRLDAPRCVHELVQRQARATPGATAVVFGDTQLTYAELTARAHRLAHALRGRGVGPEVRVAICLERSPELVIAVLGVLAAGGAYLPLDPAYPVERLNHMLDDAQPVLVVTQQSLRHLLPADAAVLLVDGEPFDAHDITPPPIAVGPQNLAYVIYTSGSTGRPKGTLLQHGGLCNLVANQIRVLSLSPASRVLQFAALSFDASVWETFATLAAGGTLVLAAPAELQPGKALADTLRRHAVTFVTLPPSVLAVLRDVELPMLTTVVSAGEACTPGLAERWKQGRRFVNAYGPTESTVCATLADYAGGERLTIGRALENIAVHVLDERLQPVAPGVTGELYIGGAGLARGYHGRPALTAERFLPDPFAREPGARMYRSGDHVRLLADGELEFVGRSDDQVKIRGFRIELGEVEAALDAHPGVRKGVAAARGASPAELTLIGYVVPAIETLDAGDVLAFLARRLPGHMVPSALVVLDAFPVTPAGKVDRAALPSPRATEDAPSARPADAMAQALATLFAEVLALPAVGLDDNFFDLGGHSILAAHLVARVEEDFGFELPLRDVFDTPTPRGLAARMPG